MREARPLQFDRVDAIGSQTGGSSVFTKDYGSLSFSLYYEGFCFEALTEQKLR